MKKRITIFTARTSTAVNRRRRISDTEFEVCTRVREDRKAYFARKAEEARMKFEGGDAGKKS